MNMRTSLSTAIALALAGAATGAAALDFTSGEWSGSLDTTVSYGVSVRAENPNDNTVGKANLNPLFPLLGLTNPQQRAAPGRWSVNGDDANLKWDKGDVVSNTAKITSEFALNWRNFGAFLRGTAFYDWEYEGRNDISRYARDKVGRDAKILDAFVFWNFGESGGLNGSLRLGQQVVSWGENTFIQNGINVINPVDVSRLRVAGAELKEAFLPVNMVFASVNVTQNLAFEGMYLLEFEQTEPEPVGTFFSTNDFATLGGTYAMLNFGTVPQPVLNPDLFWDVCYGNRPSDIPALNQPVPAGPGGALIPLYRVSCQAALPRGRDRYPRDRGDWGLAMRYFAENLNSTEFGLYYMNYASRLPLISGNAVTNSNPNSGRVFVEYPDDIKMVGLSANTLLPWGVAFQGEVSHKTNVPLQIDDVEVLFAGLSPLNALIPQPGLRFRSQLGEFAPGAEIQGWERHKVWQGQFTLTKVFGPGNWLAADQVSIVIEVGGTKVRDLPDPSVLRYQGDGTDTGGGPDVTSGALRNPITQVGGFPTEFSWGYRLAMRADYSNAFGTPFLVSPRLAFNHDVNGTTPGPGGNFVEDRKSYTLGVEANYLQRWAVDLSYTRFFGAGMFNTLADRDFYSISARYSF
ncbi:MAG: DUF1302 domain-containing protein [Xanthomonadales bacterium]|nr:DUF1302 domain-containing protein [Xanthomonadales bacterium]